METGLYQSTRERMIRERTRRLKQVIRAWIRVDSSGYRISRAARRTYYRGYLAGYDDGRFAGRWLCDMEVKI